MTFIVVLGPDGAGKSTLIRSARAIQPAWRYVTADPVDLYPIHGLEYMNWTLKDHPRVYLPNMLPFSRASFFVQTISAQLEYHIAPALRAGEVVVCDSYYFRFLAKESIFNPEGVFLISALTAKMPVPSLVVYLDVPSSVAFSRKLSLSAFETLGGNGIDAFSDFQLAVSTRLLALTAGIPSVHIDGNKSPVHVLGQFMAHVQNTIRDGV